MLDFINERALHHILIDCGDNKRLAAVSLEAATGYRCFVQSTNLTASARIVSNVGLGSNGDYWDVCIGGFSGDVQVSLRERIPAQTAMTQITEDMQTLIHTSHDHDGY